MTVVDLFINQSNSKWIALIILLYSTVSTHTNNHGHQTYGIAQNFCEEMRIGLQNDLGILYIRVMSCLSFQTFWRYGAGMSLTAEAEIANFTLVYNQEVALTYVAQYCL